MRKTNNGKHPLTRADKLNLLNDVRKGQTYAAVSEIYGVSKERVRQIVLQLDPDLIAQRKKKRQTPPPPPPPIYCAVHKDRKLRAGQRKYCTPSCAEAMRVLKYLTDHRMKHLDLVARRGGWKGARAESRKHQILHKNSKSYRVLKKQGLLGKLPKRVEIR